MFSFVRSAVLSKFVLLSLVLSLISPTTLFAFSEGLIVVAGSDQTISLGESLVLDGEAYASNLDASSTGLTAATIDWGDGTIENASVTFDAAGFYIKGSHLYSSAGDFTVSVCANDLADGIAKCDEFVVTVTAADLVASDLIFDPAGASNNYHVLFTGANIGAESVYYSNTSPGANAVFVNGVMPSGDYEWHNLSVSDRGFLNAGASITGLRATPGSVELLEGDVVQVCVDVNDDVLESNEDNNCVSATFTTASETGEETTGEGTGGEEEEETPILPDFIPTNVYAWDLINTEYIALADIPSGADPLDYVINIESLNQGASDASALISTELLFELCAVGCTDEEVEVLISHNYGFFGLADTSVWAAGASVLDNAEEITVGDVEVTSVPSLQYCVDAIDHVLEADETNNCISFANPFFVGIPAEEETPEDACEQEDDDLSFEGGETPEGGEEDGDLGFEGGETSEDACEEEDGGLGFEDEETPVDEGEEDTGGDLPLVGPDMYLTLGELSSDLRLDYRVGNSGDESVDPSVIYNDLTTNRFYLDGEYFSQARWFKHLEGALRYTAAGGEQTRYRYLYWYEQFADLEDGVYVITACTDHDRVNYSPMDVGVVSEVDQLNNCSSYNIGWDSSLLPDLYASDLDLDMTTGLLSYTLGNAGASNVIKWGGYYSVSLNGTSVLDQSWETDTDLTYLNKGMSLERTYTFNPDDFVLGANEVKVCMDSTNIVRAELSEENNCATFSFSREEEVDDEGTGTEEGGEGGIGIPDKEIPEIERLSPDLYVENAVYDSASMILSYEIGNKGSVSLLAADYPDGRNRFRLNGVNLQITPWSFHSALFNAYATAGAERTRYLPLYFFGEMLSLGDGTTNELEICTDSSNLVAESDETNNCTTVSFVYDADLLPDLYASINSVDDSFVYFNLGNAGLVDVFPSQFGVTEYYLDGAVVYNDVWSTSTVAASYLASEGVLSDQFSIEGLADGEHTFKVCVDTVNRIEAELSEANNCASTTFSIGGTDGEDGTGGGLGDGGTDDGGDLSGDGTDPSDTGTGSGGSTGGGSTGDGTDGEDGTGGGLGDGGTDDGGDLSGDGTDPSDTGTGSGGSTGGGSTGDGTDGEDGTGGGLGDGGTDDGGDLSGDGMDPSDTGTGSGGSTGGSSSGGSSGGVATPGSGSGSSGGSGSGSSGGVILTGSEEVILTGEEIAACGEMNFVDVSEDHEDYDAIYQLWCEGVVHGRDVLHFVPGDWIKRDEVAKIVARLFGYVTLAHSDIPEVAETSYADVSSDEALVYYVEVMTDEGYFEEEAVEGEFRPHEDMSYGEIVDLIGAVTGGEVALSGYESEDSVERGVFATFVLSLFQ